MSHPDNDEAPAARKTSPADGANDSAEVARELAKHVDAPKMDKYARFQLLVIVSLLGAMLFFGGRELLYSLLGKTIDAKVTRQKMTLVCPQCGDVLTESAAIAWSAYLRPDRFHAGDPGCLKTGRGA